MISPLIVALDYANERDALILVDRLDPAACRVKVGKELFTACGPAIVGRLQERGFDVFLDLKFHDIPQTVAKACRTAAGLGVWMLNVHASGGSSMLRAAREAVNAAAGGTQRTLLVAVTVLTSMNDATLREVGVNSSVGDQVERLATLAAECALDGIVCSALEAGRLRVAVPELLRVTPGIRPAQDAGDDQRRIMAPAAAVAAGADFLVVGRPITAAEDPARALSRILSELAGDPVDPRKSE
ncbi:orotidine-5'-phosphate decarboxylase [Acidithiobacillus ferriphilus]|uniref:orotidine-5'-phosphate decarboxylase n=1 Tax=Acidithiobacillus ferriphilus TaxID=1689834 RepID=UPI001E5C65F7|nr:orotidine-5'-phosphate decarboxylase [Acidithiobacillus ferriphilus]UEP59079.1 orotidine-5'-phosphate decarboxylase [Acidithiobacillus ferriphilus]